MIKHYRNVYYYGEFGYFNFMVLGHLESYFSQGGCPLVLHTYGDYFRILDHAFPGKFFRPNEVVVPVSRKARIYHSIQDDAFNKLLKNKGNLPLQKVLGCEIKDWVEGRGKIRPIKNPLIVGQPDEDKKYISLVCRKRVIDEDRNLSADTWQRIIADIKAVYPNHQLVFHGLREETVDIAEVLFCADILQSISYLNRSLFFVSSMSGFAQFASNCACSILQIGPDFQMIPYNPFHKINTNLDRNDLAKFKDHIRQYAL